MNKYVVVSRFVYLECTSSQVAFQDASDICKTRKMVRVANLSLPSDIADMLGTLAPLATYQGGTTGMETMWVVRAQK